jgi:phosphomannomutase
MKANSSSAFRLGDVRGIYPASINEEFSARFAVAFTEYFKLNGAVATGRDMRDSSLALQSALNRGFASAGIEVLDLGLCATELGYFASAQENISAAIIVTASHNPPQYNGLKCVLSNGVAVTFETGLAGVEKLMRAVAVPPSATIRKAARYDLHPLYIDYIKSRFPTGTQTTASIALNGLNGTAATLADTLASELKIPVTWYRKDPGPIPLQGADPTNPRLAKEMKKFMAGQDFDLGVTWDGDCDRCVFFDRDGRLLPTYYIIGLLARSFLESNRGAAIVFDTKLCLNTIDVIRNHNGKPVQAETGHAFMKRAMRDHKAIYGGELSAHHYFADFYSCDSGMYAWLKILEIVRTSGQSITGLVSEYRENVCCTPEISVRIDDTEQAFARALQKYDRIAARTDHFDGLSFHMPGDWRFTLRQSKTEPLVRINFESRADPDLLLEDAVKVIDMLKVEGNSWHDELYIQ